ncbi:class I SAM-dependent methyltransferase [Chryseobacterium taklimakanense]|uniref:Class I SAM-dependent methyltransferase n=1 Tax=Chryseobacterium taklimakanense TaxID=536441 RepID=A0A3G8WW66_9FLAO|nr:class I SAM-dependent methyltransferase [Chryseobacterium taklimakanense]AZI19996.1 class I SAM-dependent methyltransferase [Chryseobacterium taklimakanense]
MAWFKTWFNTPYYHILYKNRDLTEAEAFISLLVKDLELPEYAEIIDLACGKGRHSVYLNDLGYRVLGLDLSAESIAHNKQFENEDLKFEVHDMRDKIEGGKVDAVFNLFTSFGYFDDPQDDKKVFSSVFDILKQDGYFVLDFLNEKYVKNTLVEETVVERNGIDFKIKKKIEGQHVIKDIYFNDKGEDFHFFEKVKLHTLEEIDALATECGFQREKLYGNYSLGVFELETSPRCINIFKKVGV